MITHKGTQTIHTERLILRRFTVDYAQAILEQIRTLYPYNEFIFFRGRQPLSTCTFNSRIKKTCKEIGIGYQSYHRVRFSTVSIMYKNGGGAPELQKMLGHTSLAMTTHYLRSVTPQEDTLAKMNSVLG